MCRIGVLDYSSAGSAGDMECVESIYAQLTDKHR